MHAITLELNVSASAAVARTLIHSSDGIGRWWSVDNTIDPRLGGVGDVRFQSSWVRMKTEAVDERSITLRCIEDHGMPYWLGSRLTLSVDPDGAGSRVRLVHDEFRARTAHVVWSEGTWKHFLRSFGQAAETNGVGTPFTKGAPAWGLVREMLRLPWLQVRERFGTL